MTTNDKTISKPLVIDYSKDAAERSIVIVVVDKDTGLDMGEKIITKGQLAKFFQPITDHQVIGSVNGKFRVEF